jgi:hypothetical protein
MGAVTAVATLGVTTHTGEVGNDTLTDTVGETSFFGDGGQDIVNLGDSSGQLIGNNVFFGDYYLDGTQHAQTITNSLDQAFQGFWGVANGTGPSSIGGLGSTSADITTINNFAMAGGNHDWLTFNVDAWAGGSDLKGGLVEGDGFGILNGPATMQLVDHGGTVNAGTNFVLYEPGGLSGASDLAAALSGIGAIKIFGGANIFAGNHMLFAYDVGTDIHIADVDFVNGLTPGGNTFGRTIVASDIADIVGGNNGTTTSLTILGINAHDVQFVHHA